jgi:hypothetical protein
MMIKHKNIRNHDDYDDWEYGTEPLPDEPWLKGDVMTTTTLPDGQVRVCLANYGQIACCYVSSMHLVEDKVPQLRESIQRKLKK